MQISVIDTITGNDVIDLEYSPFVIEGKGKESLKIFFENEYSKEEYLLFEAENADARLIDCYNEMNCIQPMATI